ncbi:CYFA0S18e00210g1_1 [Cyberlindnera fabianii]|uniref:CYFA0S18e00210g1_1 n=1 Tax=Cyberlindnera fabianii TaxID=36022 RepID=A0A061B7K4_CYBFA|nr:hypothetical protein BON22_1169 [Cyberlindnera fabianii]CDR45365.1 CYFA0S18e00210g1_1 [Cyberlindnera fabianii]
MVSQKKSFKKNDTPLETPKSQTSVKQTPVTPKPIVGGWAAVASSKSVSQVPNTGSGPRSSSSGTSMNEKENINPSKKKNESQGSSIGSRSKKSPPPASASDKKRQGKTPAPEPLNGFNRTQIKDFLLHRLRSMDTSPKQTHDSQSTKLNNKKKSHEKDVVFTTLTKALNH